MHDTYLGSWTGQRETVNVVMWKGVDVPLLHGDKCKYHPAYSKRRGEKSLSTFSTKRGGYSDV